MKNNISSIDRVLRIGIAIIFSALFITETVTGALAYILLALGGFFILTSAINSCPVYLFFGLSTCKNK
jgi:ABC-type transport system involved in cytochrome bd biosynthesis fused ATPase/permease subunit